MYIYYIYIMTKQPPPYVSRFSILLRKSQSRAVVASAVLPLCFEGAEVQIVYTWAVVPTGQPVEIDLEVSGVNPDYYNYPIHNYSNLSI